MPSMPRFRTPARSLMISPTVPRTSGVATRRVAAIKAMRKVVISAMSIMQPCFVLHLVSRFVRSATVWRQIFSL